MEKKSKIKSIIFERDYEGKFGKMYVYQATLEDGGYGEIQTKTENKYKVGEEIVYTLKSRQYNNQTLWTITVVTPPQNQFKGSGTNPEREQSIIRQSSLKCAVELCNAGKIDVKNLLVTAEKLVEWVNKK
jgi:hypothetical protein